MLIAQCAANIWLLSPVGGLSVFLPSPGRLCRSDHQLEGLHSNSLENICFWKAFPTIANALGNYSWCRNFSSDCVWWQLWRNVGSLVQVLLFYLHEEKLPSTWSNEYTVAWIFFWNFPAKLISLPVAPQIRAGSSPRCSNSSMKWSVMFVSGNKCSIIHYILWLS